VPQNKVVFVNKSISDSREIFRQAGLSLKRDEKLVYFFDPPWGGLSYQSKQQMVLDDFHPYPLREALTEAFRFTSSMILKLPKNMNIGVLLKDLQACYEKGCGKLCQLPISITLLKSQSFAKFYLVVTGNQLVK